MRNSRLIMSGAVAVVATLCIAAIAMQDGSGAPPMTPEQMTEMLAHQEAGRVTDKQLSMVEKDGIWDADLEFWMMPGAPSSKSIGSEERTMVLGGRYMRCTFECDFMGMPFRGEMMFGYDNARGVWQSNWCDNMSTSMTRGTGTQVNDDTINWVFEETNPVTKSTHTTWGVTRDLGPNKQVMEFWRMGDGKKYKMMQISYTRRT